MKRKVARSRKPSAKRPASSKREEDIVADNLTARLAGSHEAIGNRTVARLMAAQDGNRIGENAGIQREHLDPDAKPFTRPAIIAAINAGIGNSVLARRLSAEKDSVEQSSAEVQRETSDTKQWWEKGPLTYMTPWLESLDSIRSPEEKPAGESAPEVVEKPWSTPAMSRLWHKIVGALDAAITLLKQDSPVPAIALRLLRSAHADIQDLLNLVALQPENERVDGLLAALMRASGLLEDSIYELEPHAGAIRPIEQIAGGLETKAAKMKQGVPIGPEAPEEEEKEKPKAGEDWEFWAEKLKKWNPAFSQLDSMSPKEQEPVGAPFWEAGVKGLRKQEGPARRPELMPAWNEVLACVDSAVALLRQDNPAAGEALSRLQQALEGIDHLSDASLGDKELWLALLLPHADIQQAIYELEPHAGAVRPLAEVTAALESRQIKDRIKTLA